MSDDDMDYSEEEYSEDEGVREEWLYMEEREAAGKASAMGMFSCLKPEEVDKMLNQSIDRVNRATGLCPAIAKLMLHAFSWDADKLILRYEENPEETLAQCRVKATGPCSSSRPDICAVCAGDSLSAEFRALGCDHLFCVQCWASYFEVQIAEGVSTGISCMALKCEVRAPEDFVLTLVQQPTFRERYQQLCFQDYVKSHPELKFCPGTNCSVIIHGKEDKAGLVTCTVCKTKSCFMCGVPPHAPADCSLIKKWFTKCADDSETANYISANTKDCPKCRICIEKNGGCNHMQCSGCKHDFCWMCLGEWRTHGSEYYECSKYRENPNVGNDSQNTQAREALKKYLHYYERWENHANSLRLEKQTLEKLKNRIDDKIERKLGTWIDWQPYFDGADLLASCRYTLQYTYPYAYYMEAGKGKTLFEYQQGQLEAEIENLSWIIERAETTDMGELKNQMHLAEKMRKILLKDFEES